MEVWSNGLTAQELDEKYRKAKDLVEQNYPHIHRAESPFGIPCFSPSTNVFHPLQKPIEIPPPSTEIYCCLPVLLSEAMEKRQGVSCFRGLANEEKRAATNKDCGSFYFRV